MPLRRADRPFDILRVLCGNPFSSLWKVTRSARPPRTSVAVLVLAGCPMVEI